ncbi:glycosyltransferase [Flavobacterium sp. AG291]|uniref:glycosyltransferase n=1 Tax=Flavobacterium sp. AG291 TaxID=2184000 RepID=UPI000E0A3982|nr:glycosyltransferase [Flavobacterium sp. AG291]RDI07967.1 glycosyltransferase involved in cell wall biosynthesis [Flavobacterium sp. AG291]
MKKAIVIDWLDKYGGAERVIGAFEKVFSFDITYTLANIMPETELDKIYTHRKPVIVETPLKRFGSKFRALFFTFPYFIRTLKVSKDVELIISSSHAVAKGIKKTSPGQLHISYFQARNCNYIWGEYKLYFGFFGHIIYPLISLLRKIDRKQAQEPDFIICNSFFVKNWVKEKYKRDASVIYPPVDLSCFSLQPDKEDYYVAVGRLADIKRFDIAIEAFKAMGKKLIIIGDGDQAKKLKAIAGSNPNIVFTGFLDSLEVNDYISKARGFIQTGIEGFGISPIEAQACGTPVIAFGYGGVLETVKKNETGVFFDEQTVHSLTDAVGRFEQLHFDYAKIRSHSLQFSKERFEKEIKEYVERKWDEHINTLHKL